MPKRTLEYQKVLNLRHNVDDPWKSLANAVVEVAAYDYRRCMQKKVTHGLSMSELELRYVDARINEVARFYESDWGYFLSHGLSPVIWEKLQKEFAEQLARFDICYPYAVKRRAKLERRRKRAEARWVHNKHRRKRQKAAQKTKKREAAQAALPVNKE